MPSPDALTTTELIASIKDVILALAAVFTATIAYKGLKKWRLELTGKAEFEAALALIRNTYKLRDALDQFRNPFMLSWEFPEGFTREIPSSAKENADGHRYAYNNRDKPLLAALREFEVAVLESEVLFGKDIVVKAQALRKCVFETRRAASQHIRNLASNGQDFIGDKKLQNDIEQKLWNDGEDSEFNERIQNSIAAIEELVRPHLKRN